MSHRYHPRHAHPRTPTARRTAAGVTLAGATAVTGLAMAPAASAAPGSTVWDRVAACESGGNWAINTGNGFYGGLQFHPQTWRGFGGGVYAAYAHQATRAEQIVIAKKVLKTQGPNAWPVCSRRAGLTVANGLAVVVNVSAGTVSGGSVAGGSSKAPRRTPSTPSRSTSRSGTITPVNLVVDGVRGRKTNSAIERWVGARVDGRLTSADWRRLEARFGGDRDGRFEAFEVKRLQRLVGTRVDGDWGPLTTKALQRYLNKR